MSKLYKGLLVVFAASLSLFVSAQQGYWSSRSDAAGITTDKAVARQTYPKEFRLFDLNIAPLRQQLFSIVGDNARGRSTIISLPNAAGNMEQFEVWEASNFEPALQARFPEIRAYSGRGITTKGATLKLSIAPDGIETMVFKIDGPTEYMEPYSADHNIYSVFSRDKRQKGDLPWVCSTKNEELATDLTNQVNSTHRPESNDGTLRTMRLAQSCNGEYSNYFGATSSAQVALVLAAFNATLTRCNGCYEKDLAVHLNLIANTTAVIYYDPATDPYTTLANWNAQLQATLTANIGEANYDIGHMFGASGGGGNAGCIGCVCVDGQKGSGITSPADAIPKGDNFDIDYVVHEVGHQLGGRHSFTFSSEGGALATSAQREVGSGITIMGYAGITPQDVAPHSIDGYEAYNIDQIQANLATKTCPVTTPQTGLNATPVVAALTSYTIPPSTPFMLNGSATDANAGDVLSYSWEQNDPSTTLTGANSVASPTKASGPNWLAFSDTSLTYRLCPGLATILAGNSVTGPLPGGDAGANIEALSSVSRTLNFRLLVRDNHPYNSPAGAVGQTAFADMTVTVDAGTFTPFLITSQNSAVSYAGGTTQTVTWSVGNTTAAPISAANVKISWSTDNGQTFSTLIASTANDGTETFTVPSTVTTQARIKVEAIGNIFFDINNAPITVTLPVNGYTFGTPTNGSASCPAAGPINGSVPVVFQGTYTGPVAVAYLSGAPAGTTVTVTGGPFTANGTATVSLSGTGALVPGTYNITVQGTGPAPGTTQNAVVSFTVNPGSGPTITSQPSNSTNCVGTTATFSVTAPGATAYQWQFSNTGCGGTFSNVAGATAATYNLPGITAGQNGQAFRCIVTGQCGVTTSNCVTLTVNTAPAITSNPSNIAVCSGSAASFTVAATGSGLTYQWQLSTGGGPFNNVAGATNPTYTIASTTLAMNGDQYRCVVSGTCPSPVTSTAATLTVNSSVTVTGNPSNQTICEGTGTSFAATASGSGLSYQWQVSTDGGVNWSNVANNATYSGATSPTLVLTNTPPTFNQNRYRCNITSPPCTPGITASALLTVNSFPVITAQPVSQTFCEGSNATLSVTATTSVGTLSYQWQASTNGGASFFNLVLPGSTVTPTNTNTLSQTAISAVQNGYQYRCVVTAGCGSSNSNAATFTVNTYPVFTLNALPKSICISDPAQTLTASISSGAWSGSGVSAAGVFTPSVAGIGIKPVTYTATNAGCTKAITSQVQVLDCPDRHRKLNEKYAVIVLPNPNRGNFSLKMNSDLYTNLGVKVFGADGRLYRTFSFSGLTYGSVIPMDLTSLSQGTYYLYMYNSENGFISRGDGVIIYH